MRALAALMGRERREGRSEVVEMENFRQRQTDERMEYLLDQMLAIVSPSRYTKYKQRLEAKREAGGVDEHGLEYTAEDPTEFFDIEELVRRGQEDAPPGANMPDEAI